MICQGTGPSQSLLLLLRSEHLPRLGRLRAASKRRHVISDAFLRPTIFQVVRFASRNVRERQEAREAMHQQCELRDVRNRRLFVRTTDKLGLGPIAMQERDVVAILRGLSFPCLLRPLGRDYQFVGVVYVYGIMEGEAVQNYRDQDGEGVVFNLR